MPAHWKENPLIGHIMTLFTVLIWGSTFVSTKVLLEHLHPVVILFCRFLIAYAVLWLFYPRFKGFGPWREERVFLGLGICGVTLYFLLENIALQYTSTANVGLLVSIAPILTAIFAHFLIKGEPFKLNFVLGFVVAILGIGIVVFNGQGTLNFNPLGDFLAIGAAAVWAIYSVLLKKIKDDANPIYITRRIFFYGLLTSLPFLFLFDLDFSWQNMLGAGVLPNLFFLGLTASALCFVMWNTAVNMIGVVRTGNYIYLIPLINIIAAIIVLHEKITPYTTMGAILILLGTYLSERGITIVQKIKQRSEL